MRACVKDIEDVDSNSKISQINDGSCDSVQISIKWHNNAIPAADNGQYEQISLLITIELLFDCVLVRVGME